MSASGSFAGRSNLLTNVQDREAMAPADLVQLSRLRLDAVRRVNHHHDAVGRNQRPVGILAEILVARSVEQRHAAALQLELERCRRNGNATLLFELHPVGRRRLSILTSTNGAGQLDGAGVQQQFFRKSRLAGVGVRDDGECAAPGDLALELALD